MSTLMNGEVSRGSIALPARLLWGLVLRGATLGTAPLSHARTPAAPEPSKYRPLMKRAVEDLRTGHLEEAYKCNLQRPVGAGTHPLIADYGWQSSWPKRLLTEAAARVERNECNANRDPSQDSPPDNQQYSIDSLAWHEAFASCARGEGRLPTEAAWEHAAAAGDENRVYPLGAAAPVMRGKYEHSSISVEVASYPTVVDRRVQDDLPSRLDADHDTGTGATWNESANLLSRLSQEDPLRVTRGSGYSDVSLQMCASSRDTR